MGANATRFGGNPDQVALMGHSAGAAHVAQYLACSEFHVAPRGGVVCAVMLSGLFDPSTAEVNPPLQAYFGIDTSLYSGRSAVPGLVACDVPMLIAFAELDPEDFCQQGRQLQLHLANAGKSAQVVQLMGHSHMSEIYSINTRDTMLTALLSAFIEKSTSVGGHAALLVRE
jgi:triacylglycerol lipase